jgi:hypothetical protein
MADAGGCGMSMTTYDMGMMGMGMVGGQMAMARGQSH